MREGLRRGVRTKNPNYGLHEAGPTHVRKGGRGRRGVSHAPPPDDEHMQEIKKRDVISEVSIAVDELINTPIPQQIIEMGWERVVAPRIGANMNIVREFYYSINPSQYRAEGVIVRGVRVFFNEFNLNRFFGTLDLPNYFKGFPFTNDFVGPMHRSVAEELRMYPMKSWTGKKQRIDHRELSTDLAFWNDFVSHDITPRAQYQKLRDTHPKIILCINRAERFDLGTVMCLSLDWHLRRKKQIVFPCTITALCQLAGIDVTNEDEEFLKPVEPMGSKTFARMAGSREYQGYLNNEVDLRVDCESGNAGDAETEAERDDGLHSVLEGLQNVAFEIMNRLDCIANTIQGLQSCMWEMGSRLTRIEDHLRDLNVDIAGETEGNNGGEGGSTGQGEEDNMEQ